MKRRYLIYAAIVLLIAAILAGALIYSLGEDNESTPVTLPSSAPGMETPSAEQSAQTGQNVLSVKPENVQAILAELSRAEDYRALVETELFFPGGSRRETIELWVKDGRARSVSGRSGSQRNCLAADGRFRIWYDDEPDKVFEGVFEGDAAHFAESLYALPDFTEIAALDPAAIRLADYETRNGIDCVRVLADRENGTAEYLVALETGLLVSYVQTEEGAVLYSLSAEITVPSGAEESLFQPPAG